MKEILLPKAVQRDPQYVYYIDGEGNVCRAKKTGRGKNKPQETKKSKIIKELKDWE